MHIKVVGVLYQLLIKNGSTLEPWKALPFSSTLLHDDKIAKCLFFARLWPQCTGTLFGDEVLSLRDVEKDCAVVSILFKSRDDRIPWPITSLWATWFAVLVPDMDSPPSIVLPMHAYATLASSSRCPAHKWPHLLQVNRAPDHSCDQIVGWRGGKSVGGGRGGVRGGPLEPALSSHHPTMLHHTLFPPLVLQVDMAAPFGVPFLPPPPHPPPPGAPPPPPPRPI